MLSFSKEHDRNVFSCPFYCVKWGPQNLVITAPARIGFTAFNRVCSSGHPVIYDTARVITKGSNPTKSDQSGPTPFLCGDSWRQKHEDTDTTTGYDRVWIHTHTRPGNVQCARSRTIDVASLCS